MEIEAMTIGRPIDLVRARSETPGCTGVAHFNNAGASLPPQPVLDAVIGHLRLEAEIGGYEAAERAADAIEGCYGAVARLLNCAPEEIAIRSEEHTSELQSLMRTSYAVFCS